MTAMLISKQSSRADVFAVPTPPPTSTYFPVPYAEFITRIEKKIKEMLPWEIDRSQYSLAKNGSQLFAAINLRSTNNPAIDSIMPSVIAAIGHDGMMKGKVGAGGSCTACSNGIFATDGVMVMRKHTKNFYRDFDNLLELTFWDFRERFHKLEEGRLRMKDMPITTERGYEILGRAFGEFVLSPQQFTLAVSEWQQPGYGDAFRERDAWSLYNAITSGLKKGHFRHAIKRFSGAHDWFAGNVVDVDVVE
tara:strand:- start:1557 stop:2303 length:747 start_codon:yes stop_codon:yes gene_type:complete